MILLQKYITDVSCFKKLNFISRTLNELFCQGLKGKFKPTFSIFALATIKSKILFIILTGKRVVVRKFANQSGIILIQLQESIPWTNHVITEVSFLMYINTKVQASPFIYLFPPKYSTMQKHFPLSSFYITDSFIILF